MSFEAESTGYEKTVLSELQGAWQVLRDEVAEQAGFPGWDRALFHIDEAMSWESVRNLQTMHNSLVLVRNLLGQEGVPEIVSEHLEVVNDLMTETLQVLKGQKARKRSQGWLFLRPGPLELGDLDIALAVILIAQG